MLSVWHRRTECDINSLLKICSYSVEWSWTRSVLYIYLFTTIYLFCISFNLKESFVLFDTNPPPNPFFYFYKTTVQQFVLMDNCEAVFEAGNCVSGTLYEMFTNCFSELHFKLILQIVYSLAQWRYCQIYLCTLVRMCL